MEIGHVFHMHWYWQNLGWDGYVSICAIFKRVMARENFVSAQYLKNDWMEYDQICHVHWWDIIWDFYA